MFATARRFAATALPALALSAALASSPRAESGIDFSAMSDAERQAFGEAVRQFLLDNPETVYDALQALQIRREAEQEEAERAVVAQYLGALHDTSYAWEGGNPEGDITVVEFLDYRCGFCKRAHPAVKEVLERDPNVRLIVREFPILGPESVAAGRMAMAGYRLEPELYPQLNDALMSHEGALTETMAYRIADGVGYDIAELKSLANSDEIAREIDKTYQLAEVLEIQGTPTFIVGNQIVRGFQPVDEFLQTIAGARRTASN
ncbi:MAG: DsbA family protein [Pseudomonadota bacterium]